MTDTERIAQMAREAGFAVASMDDVRYDPYATSEILLARFARLVAEDCAQIVGDAPMSSYRALEMAQRAIRDRYVK